MSESSTFSGRRALVAGADTRDGVAVARVLTRLGVTVVGLARDVTARSARKHLWAEVLPVAEGWIDALHTAHARYGRLPLLPATDDAVRELAARPDVTEQLCTVVLPHSAVVERLLDPVAFREWAHACGFPVPLTRVVTGQDELDGATEELAYPLTLTPFGGGERVRLDSMDDVLTVRPIPDGARVVVEERVDDLAGSRRCTFYRDRSGRTLTARGDVDLVPTASDVLRAAGHVGAAVLEFRRDTRDGRWLVTRVSLAHWGHDDLIETAFRDALPRTAPVVVQRQPKQRRDPAAAGGGSFWLPFSP